MVLTDEQQINRYPTATLEANAVVPEQGYYDINTAYVVANPPGVPAYINDNGTNNPSTFGTPTANSQKMYKLNAATNKTGLGMVLKIMAGDKLDVLGKSYYQYNGGTITNSPYTVTTLLTTFLNTAAGVNAATQHGGTVPILNTNTAGTVTPVNNFITNSSNTNPSNNVKAGLCYIIFDEQFNYITGGFDAVEPATNGGLKNHFLQNIPVNKNGYIYIYASNESNLDVFFDNLEVVHTRGAILEESHFGAWGTKLAGICSQAAGSLQNRYLFNGATELNNDFDINLYETKCRLYDPQIGRFWQVDELTDANWELTPYNFALNNPISLNDPLGLTENDPKETSTPEKPKTLSTVVITTGTPKMTQAQIQQLYVRMQKAGISTDRVSSWQVRDRLERYGKVSDYMEKVHAGIKEDGLMLLEGASWFIPVGQIMKLRYLKYAANLFN
jgi:RHS repeat-associated protein